MKRRDFTKTVLLSSLAGWSAWGFRQQDPFTPEELMGRKEPLLAGDGFQLRKEAAEAFLDMQADARKVGIGMHVESGYRSYARQELIWNRKYTSFTADNLSPQAAIDKIIEYSTIPGTSRHHWGTEADVIDRSKPIPADPLLAEHFAKGGLYEDLKTWLDKNKEKYGFYEVYTNTPGRKGFKYEPWHLSYKPLSQPMLRAFLDIDLAAYLRKVNLLGSEHFTEAFIQKYTSENLLDIHPGLL